MFKELAIPLKIRFALYFWLLADQLFTLVLIRYFPQAVHDSGVRLWNILPLPLSILTSWLIILCLLYLSRSNSRLLVAIYIMATGFASNSLTSIWHGSFVDYLPVGWWYTNMADLCIIGGILLAIVTYTKKTA